MSYETKSNFCTRNLEVANEARKKRVAQIQDGQVIKIYNSLASVKEDGFDFGLVGRVCRNERGHHKGYQFKYV